MIKRISVPNAVLLAVAANLLISGCMATDRQRVYDIPANSGYVSMGSSFAAGPGIEAAVEDSPRRCGRSTNNYAHQVARTLNLSLTDVSCSGAKSEHILEDWRELPAQIEAVNSTSRLVTVITGGNDLGYIGGLMATACENRNNRSDDPEKKRCLSPFPLPTEDDYLATENRMNEVARKVREKAPDAVLVFINHAKVLPDEGICEAASISVERAKESLVIAARLGEITERVAKANGALMLKASELTKNHHACADIPWMRAYPNAAWTLSEMPFHPTRSAMDAIANALVRTLKEGTSE